ncbi:MAG: imidazolonepropionase [Thermoplasmata archaeon]|nr:imidazolonepropionase [Thermoplasmata archaeon]
MITELPLGGERYLPEELIVTHAGELLTMRGPCRARVRAEMSELGVIKDGAVYVRDGIIQAVGDTPSILNWHDSPGVEKMDASGCVVMPGFVDPHTHLVFAGSREFELDLKIKGKTYMEILNGGGGILRTVRDTRVASSDQLFDQAAKRLNVMLEHGSTTVEGKSGYGLDKKTELRILKTLRRLDAECPTDVIPTYLGAHAVPPEFSGGAEEYIQFIIDEVLLDLPSSGLARFCDVFCEEGVFSIAQSRRVLLAAKSLGLGLKIHADEFERTGGAELAAEVGAVSADHLARPSDDGIMAMARKQVVGVLLPGTPFSSMERDYAEARRLIELGVPIALATDLNPNCWNPSMQFTITLACHNMKMTPAEALVASTINAAAAVGREKSIGSIEEGKAADIIVLDVPTHAHIPYRMGTNLCSLVLKGGEAVFSADRSRADG